MKKKMAFIDLTNFKDWPMGGMLEYERAILKYLVKEYDVDIWGVSVDGIANETIILDGKQYPVHIFANVKTKKRILPNYWRGLNFFKYKKLFQEKYDIIYAHTGSCLLPFKKLKKNGIKLVYHQHGLNHRVDYSLMSLIQRPGLQFAQYYADLVFVVSDKESVDLYSQEMQSKTEARYVSIGSPVDLSYFDKEAILKKLILKKELATKKFLYTGRLTAYKNVKTLIDAINLYKQNVNENMKLTIAGSGPEWDNLHQQIYDLKLEDNVEMLGNVSHDQIYQLLEEADVFLTASGGEGVSVSVIEAYASGLPVVCFDVPGLEKQVLDNVTGAIAKEKTVDAFFEAMLRVDKNRLKLSLNCLEEAEKYEDKKISEKIVTEINALF